MIVLCYSFVKQYKNLENVIFEDDFDFEPLVKALLFRLTRYSYIKKFLFLIDPELEIYTKHFMVVSQTNFRYNHRYYSHVRACNAKIIYYPGRELTSEVLQNKIFLKRVNRPIEEMFLKTIFAGLNSYELMDSKNLVHFLNFAPTFLYFYKNILKISKFFLKLDEGSLKFVYLKFTRSKKLFKKIKSIKKNLRKKNLTKLKQEDYNLVNL